MSVVVSTLTTWIDQTSSELMRKVLTEGNTIKRITNKYNVKYSESLNIVDWTLSVEPDSCTNNAGFVDSGATNLTQQILQTCALMTNTQYCLYGNGGINDYYLNYYMKPGSYHDTLPWEQVFMDDVKAKLDQYIDQNLWMAGYSNNSTAGNGHSGDTLMTGAGAAGGACKSILYNLWNTSASGSCTIVSYTATTPSNIYQIVNTIYSAFSINIQTQKDLTIFCSMNYLNMYRAALVANNSLNYFVKLANPTFLGGHGEIPNSVEDDYTEFIPGTRCQLVGTYGLQNYTGFIGSYAANFHYGTDLISDSSSGILYYSLDANNLRLFTRFKVGGQVAFPAYTVIM